MNKKIITLFVSFTIICSFILSGCVNYDQKTTLNLDGSGSMKIHYWTKMSNLESSTSIGKFEFDKKNAKSSYTSNNTTVNNVRVENNLVDSTKHVWIELLFKDINNLSNAKGFEDTKSSWKETTKGFELRYIINKDTSAANNNIAKDIKITYTFEMPGNVDSTNADRQEGRTLFWDFNLTNFKYDQELDALVAFDK